MSDLTSQQLRDEGQWLYELLLTHGDGHNAAHRFAKALSTPNLPLARLYRYAKTAWNDGMSSVPLSLPDEDKWRAAEYLAALSEREAGAGTTGPKPRGNEHRIELLLNDDELQRLDRYCGEQGIKRAQATRAAYRLLPGWNEPLPPDPTP